MDGTRRTYGERRGVYRVLVRKAEGKNPLGRPRFRWKDNIKRDHQEVGWGHGLDRAGSSRDMLPVLLNVVMNLRVP